MAQGEDYSEAYDFLYRIDRRIGALERDAEFISKNIDKIDFMVVSAFTSLRGDFAALRASTDSLKRELNESVAVMVKLSSSLKESMKKEDLEALQSHVDGIMFEELVTRSAVKRGSYNA